MLTIKKVGTKDQTQTTQCRYEVIRYSTLDNASDVERGVFAAALPDRGPRRFRMACQW